MPFHVPESDAYQNWVRLFSTHSIVEAHLIRGLLEGEGIACWLRPKGVALLPVTINSLGEIDICVDAADCEASQSILEDVRRNPPRSHLQAL